MEKNTMGQGIQDKQGILEYDIDFKALQIFNHLIL